MGSNTGAGETPHLFEDTVDLGGRLDPVRTLLRRTAAGDQEAAASLVNLLSPRVHGLALHITGSPVAAGALTVEVLRTCLRDAAELAAGSLPGEAAVLDRARRAAVSTRPSGDVRSLVAPDGTERTRDHREAGVIRALLSLPPAQRAVVEAAAQGRFPYTGERRATWAALLARVLDRLVTLGGPEHTELRALAALDALGLAEENEKEQLRSLTATAESAAVHRHAIEAAARLTLLTTAAPSRDLTGEILQNMPLAEARYRGTYETPVLGTDAQRRIVGPPALAGGAPTGHSPAAPPVSQPPVGASGQTATPAFAFDAGRPTRRARDDRSRSRPARGPWPLRAAAAVCLLAALIASGLAIDARRTLSRELDVVSSAIELSVGTDAELVPGISDNGTWVAILGPDAVVVGAEGVTPYGNGEVLQLWAETEDGFTDLGVLDPDREGRVRHHASTGAKRLLVTREMAPRNQSGTPSPRVVASLIPD